MLPFSPDLVTDARCGRSGGAFPLHRAQNGLHW